MSHPRRVLLRVTSSAQMACLYAVHQLTDGVDGPTKFAIEHALGVSPDTMTRTVRQLRDACLVVSSRTQGYRLTPAGREALRYAVAIAVRATDGEVVGLCDPAMSTGDLVAAVRTFAEDDAAPVTLHPLGRVAHEHGRQDERWVAVADRVDVTALGKGSGWSRQRVETEEGQGVLPLVTAQTLELPGGTTAPDTVGTP